MTNTISDRATDGRATHLHAVEVARRGPRRQGAPRVLRDVTLATTPVLLAVSSPR